MTLYGFAFLLIGVGLGLAAANWFLAPLWGG